MAIGDGAAEQGNEVYKTQQWPQKNIKILI